MTASVAVVAITWLAVVPLLLVPLLLLVGMPLGALERHRLGFMEPMAVPDPYPPTPASGWAWVRRRMAEAAVPTFLFAEASRVVGGRDLVEEALVHPATPSGDRAEDVQLRPTAGHWSDPGRSRQLPKQPLRPRTGRRLGALQHENGFIGDCHAAIFVPVNNPECIGEQEIAETWR
ncbi:sensor domain-containing protein [Actinoplanes palleronii]|uniref:sensor domain-containing protein n=1 Tax=Actinoplanes palleronii TaxID=113570 RepID=UPI00194324DC|nr:sensor domain-containing protein [Actinoplanes palleronii]